jgi:hypothetical protein
VRRGLLILLASFAGLLVAGLGVADTTAQAPWKSDGTVDGMQVEHRDVAGSSFDEVRVTSRSPLSLDRLCEAIYPKRVDGKLEGRFLKKELLRETDTERWTYEQISVPVVTNRDYVMHVKLEQPASTGTCRVSFETETYGTRPSPPGFVRIALIRGLWQLAPMADGAVSIRYQIFSDPGGSVPAFLARGKQRDAAVEFMKTILARASAPPAAQQGASP